jgi:putative CocE/NonD family hydrolase
MKLKKLTRIAVITVLVLFIGVAISGISSKAFAAVQMFEQMVSMRDGVKLHTFIYLPDPDLFGDGPYPTIVGRTPYGIGTSLPGNPLPGGILRGWEQITENGYAFVVQDARGRFLSEGMDRSELDEPNDGYDTIEWAAAQTWCNGEIGMAGSSAPGFRSYAAASARPPHLKAIFAQAASVDLFNDTYYQGGAFEHEFWIFWRAFQSGGLSADHIQSVGLTPAEGTALKAQAASITTDMRTHLLDYKASIWWLHLPLSDFPALGPLHGDVWNEFLSHPAPDAFRDSQNWLKSIEIPAIHVTTVYDCWHDSMLKAFNTLQKKVGNQRLYVGPGNHFNVYSPTFWPYDPFFMWFDYWLKGIDTWIMDLPAIYYYYNGTDTWRYLEQWPLPGVKDKKYFLREGGELSTKHPNGKERSTSYVYDPRDPVQTLGGRGLWWELGGAADQRPVEPPYRTDVLVYTTKVLDEDVEIGGNAKVILHASSTAEDTDFTGKLIDVYPDGSTIIVLEGVIRGMLREFYEHEGKPGRGYGGDRHAPQPKPLIPGEPYKFVINLNDVNYLFKAGHQIQVDISSSNFPRRARNTNSGNLFYTFDGDEDIVIVRNTIYHHSNHPSYLVLPEVQKKR